MFPRHSLLALALLAGTIGRVAHAETALLNLLEWEGGSVVSVGEWSLKDMKKYTSGHLKDAAYFNKIGSFIESPTFPEPILFVSVESATLKENLLREVRLIPIADGKAQDGYALMTPQNENYVSERFDLSTLGATSFRLEAVGGSGNWAVRKITVAYGTYVPTVRPIENLSVSGTTSDAFSLFWDAVEDVAGYVVRIWEIGHENETTESIVTDASFTAPAAAKVYGYSVAARFVIDGSPADSTTVTGEIDMSDPPWLRCWALSSFLPKPGLRALDLSGLGKVEKLSPWTNGKDGDLIYLFADSTAARGNVRPLTESSVYGGFYIYNAGTEDTRQNELAVLGSGTTGARIVLPARLDAERSVERLSVSYAARELRAGAADTTPLTCEWAVADDMGSMEGTGLAWTEIARTDFPTANGPVDRTCDFPVKAFKSAKYLFVRWRVPKQSNSAIVGVEGIRLAGKLRNTGVMLMLR